MSNVHYKLNEPEKPNLASRIISKIVIVALILAGLGVGLIVFWANQPAEVLKINNQPFPTRSVREHATANGVIILTVDYCKVKDISGTVRMSFVSASRVVFLPESKERSPAGCQKTEFPVLIPKDLPPDKYKIRFLVTYDINPLIQDHEETFESGEFVVD